MTILEQQEILIEQLIKTLRSVSSRQAYDGEYDTARVLCDGCDTSMDAADIEFTYKHKHDCLVLMALLDKS